MEWTVRIYQREGFGKPKRAVFRTRRNSSSPKDHRNREKNNESRPKAAFDRNSRCYQAIDANVSLRLRQATNSIRAKPTSIIAQLAGSGTALDTLPEKETLVNRRSGRQKFRCRCC